jgi:hypothetical protein
VNAWKHQAYPSCCGSFALAYYGKPYLRHWAPKLDVIAMLDEVGK